MDFSYIVFVVFVVFFISNIAIGTALPELITSIIAVIKKEDDLATGNLIGSCILNSFLILGTGAIITRLVFCKIKKLLSKKIKYGINK